MTKMRLLKGVGMMFILVFLAACAARENPPEWGIPTHDVNSGKIAKDTGSIADNTKAAANELTMLRSDFAQLRKAIETANQKKSAVVTARNGEQVTNLSLVKGVLLVTDPKGWNPEAPNTCVSPHHAPIRSTMEGGPKGADFAHKLLEGRCLAPGTTLFNVEPVSNGFFMASLAVQDVGAFAYNLQQMLALPVIGHTTSGASVLRVYIKQSSLVQWMPDISPVVAVNPFTSKTNRKKFERKEYYRRMGTHKPKWAPLQNQKLPSGMAPPRTKSPLPKKPSKQKTGVKGSGAGLNPLASQEGAAFNPPYRLAGEDKIFDVVWDGPTVSLPSKK